MRLSKFFWLWPTRLGRVHIPIRADRLTLLQIELLNPQHGQLSVTTAHFKQAERDPVLAIEQ